MAKSGYEIVKCPAGVENLQNALDTIAYEERDIISILPDHGGSWISALGSGQTLGYLIVVRKAA